MKSIKVILLISFLSVIPYWTFGQFLKTMTFNLRYDNPEDLENNWANRKNAVVSLLRHYSPGIIGTQEGLAQQVKYLRDSLPGYLYAGVGREDGYEKGEYCAVFYDTARYQLLSGSTFWLSETPEKVSKGWDAALERICTCVLLKERNSGLKFWVFNTHFDHIGEKARIESARLILKKIQEKNDGGFPLILMGDFNTEKGSPAIKLLEKGLSEASSISKEPLYGPEGTFNNFISGNDTRECIDFIFVSGFSVKSITHIDDRRNNNLCISDHFPVLAEIIPFRNQ